MLGGFNTEQWKHYFKGVDLIACSFEKTKFLYKGPIWQKMYTGYMLTI